MQARRLLGAPVEQLMAPSKKTATVALAPVAALDATACPIGSLAARADPATAD